MVDAAARRASAPSNPPGCLSTTTAPLTCYWGSRIAAAAQTDAQTPHGPAAQARRPSGRVAPYRACRTLRRTCRPRAAASSHPKPPGCLSTTTAPLTYWGSGTATAVQTDAPTTHGRAAQARRLSSSDAPHCAWLAR